MRSFSILLLFLVGISQLLLSVNAEFSYGTCSSGTSFYCPACGGTTVRDCSECEGFMSSDEDHKICIDRRLFQKHNTDPNDPKDHYHFLWNDLVGAVVWFLTAGISIACGVGGGGIYVPIGILLFRFAPKQSSGFSQASIFGAALAGLIINASSKHPVEKIRHDAGACTPSEKDSCKLSRQKELSKEEEEAYLASGGKMYTRPLVDYDMALFMAPMQMAGAVLGVLVQQILPNWLYLLFASVVLSYTAYKTYKKYFAAREAELKKQRAQEEKQAAVSEEESEAANDNENQTNAAESETFEDQEEGAPTTLASVEEGNKKTTTVTTTSDDDEQLELRKKYLEDDMRQYPKEKIGALVLLWIGLFVLTLLKGGKGVESLLGIQCDSPWYAVLIACQFLWLFSFAAFFGRKLMRDQAARAAVNYPFLEDDALWDAPSMRSYVAFCFFSGVVAAMIGIGGGMVLGPFMLVMGINPRVSTATNASMIVVTSSSVAVIFVTSGLVPWSYAVFYFLVCFAGAWLGKSKIDGYVKRTGRQSMLIFILASIILFATVGCLVILFMRLVEKEWCFDDFNKFCSVNDEEGCIVDQMMDTLSGGSWLKNMTEAQYFSAGGDW